MEGQGIQLAASAALMIAVGTLFLLPALQDLIEHQRTQRAREREYLRRTRMEIEA